MNDKIIELTNEMHWYDKELLKAYFLCNKNALRLSRETKIPYRSILKGLNKLKQNGKFELFNYPEYFKKKQHIIDIMKADKNNELYNL